MAVCDWLATDAEVDRATREEARETWEYENNPEGEIEEMVELYVKKNVPEETAREAMTILAKYKVNNKLENGSPSYHIHRELLLVS